MTAHISVFEGTVVGQDLQPVPSGQWYWHCQAGNNEIVAQGEGYTSEYDAERGVSTARQAMMESDPKWVEARDRVMSFIDDVENERLSIGKYDIDDLRRLVGR